MVSARPGATCISVLPGGIGELLAADSRLIHQATFCDREGCHALVVATDGGGVFLATTGAGGAAGGCLVRHVTGEHVTRIIQRGRYLHSGSAADGTIRGPMKPAIVSLT
jgi:hypothetical protein